MLKEAHAEKSRLMESRVRLTGARRQQVVSTELPSAFPCPYSTPSPSTCISYAVKSLHFSNASWEAWAGCSVPTLWNIRQLSPCLTTGLCRGSPVLCPTLWTLWESK